MQMRGNREEVASEATGVEFKFKSPERRWTRKEKESKCDFFDIP